MKTMYGSWDAYLKELDGLKHFCKDFKQDWAFCFGGMEGAGKSTLAIKTALHLQPDFDIKTQTANSLLEYIKITMRIKDTPFQVVFFDEAVKAFFGREFGQRANIILVKLFISNRSFQQFNLLTIPNVFYLDKYIREWRLKTFTYSWIDWRHRDKRFFALYHRKRYKGLIKGAANARTAMLDREELIRRYKPNFITSFTKLEDKKWDEYSKIKYAEQLKLLNEAYDETLRLEAAKKIGFHRRTPMLEFLRWLASHFGTADQRGNIYLRFTYEFAAKEAVTAKKNINYLVNKALDNGFISKLGLQEYQFLQKGLDLINAAGVENADNGV